MNELTFRQLEELLDRQATNQNWKDFPIVMTDDLIGVKNISFKLVDGAVLVVLQP